MNMALPAALEENLNRFLQCRICFSHLKEPKILPCTHRYCRDCLEQIVERDDEKIKCPICRERHNLPEEGVGGLQTDYTKNIFEIIELQESVKDDPLKVCIRCSKEKMVAAYCFKCNNFLCEACHEYHATDTVFTDHQPHIRSLNATELWSLMVEMLSSLKLVPWCTNHPGNLLDLCCTTCGNLPICRACNRGAHRGHDSQEVGSLATTERAKLLEKVADLTRHKEEIFTLLKELRCNHGKLIQVIDGKRCKLQENLDAEERKLQTVISTTDEGWEQRREESGRERKLQATIGTTDDRREQRREESGRERREIQQGLENINSEIKDLLTKKEELTKEFKYITVYMDNAEKNFEMLATIATNIIAANHHWTDVQCIPAVCEAADLMIDEVKRVSPRLMAMSEAAARGGPSVNITEREESVIEVKEVDVISSITDNRAGSIVITGQDRNHLPRIAVVNTRGELLKQGELSGFRDMFYCYGISQSTIVTVRTPDGIGIYDTRDGNYRERNMRKITDNWPENRFVTCIAGDPDYNRTFVGCDSRDVFVFNYRLQYIGTLLLPEVTRWTRDIAVHTGNLLVCDENSMKAYAVTNEGPGEAQVLYEFTKPNLDGDEWFPTSICTDSNGFVYMLWKHKQGFSRVLTQYTEHGGQLLATKRVDGDAECITTLQTDRGEKLLIATLLTQKVYIYGLTVSPHYKATQRYNAFVSAAASVANKFAGAVIIAIAVYFFELLFKALLH